jgi:hypothetical protein
LKVLCDSMKKQILSRAFYGWLTYHRYFKTVSLHLTELIICDNENKESFENNNSEREEGENVVQNDSNLISDQNRMKIHPNSYLKTNKKLDEELWAYLVEESLNKAGEILESKLKKNQRYFYEIIYYNGIESDLRKKVCHSSVNFVNKRNHLCRFTF